MNTIRDPEQLRQFFAAKGQHNLVLRVADVLDMEPGDMALALALYLASCGDSGASDEVRAVLARHPMEGDRQETHYQGVRRALQRLGAPAGYIVLSLARLCGGMSLTDLEAVQAWLEAYRDIRRRKGHGLVTARDGSTVLRDMTAEEWALATQEEVDDADGA